MKAADLSRITDLSLANLIQAQLISENPDLKTIEWVRSLVALFKDQMSYTNQIVELSQIFFSDPDKLDDAAMAELQKDEAEPTLKAFQALIEKLPRFTATQIMQAIQQTRQEVGAKGRKLYMPIRIATTRSMHGPGIGEAIELLGYEKTQQHIAETLKQLEN